MERREPGVRTGLSFQEQLAILEAATDLGGFGIGVYSYDSSSDSPVVEFVNDILLARLRMTREEVERDPTCLFRDNTPLKQTILDRLERCDTSPFEIEVNRVDNSRYYIQMSCRRLAQDLDGHARFITLSHDVTQRRKDEAELRLLSTAVAEASDFVILTDGTPDEDGGARIVYVNNAFLQASGFQREDLIGKSYKELYHSDNDPHLLETIRANVIAGRPNFCEALLRRKDGSPLWVEFIARPFAHPYEGSAYRITIGRDISLRRRAANQVALLLAGIEASHSRTILYERDKQGELGISYENPAAAARARYRLLELLKGSTDDALEARARLASGDEFRTFYSEIQCEKHEIVEFTARSIRTSGGIEAVLTQEHLIASDAIDGH